MVGAVVVGVVAATVAVAAAIDLTGWPGSSIRRGDPVVQGRLGQGQRVG